MARYRPDPVLFVMEVFGADPDDWQREVLKAYGNGSRRISIRSCHGVGKTVVMSWIAVHHLLTKWPQKSVATAPTSAQLYDALASECKAWINRLPPPVRELLEVKTDRIELKADPDGSFLSFRTSRQESPEALQGLHSDHVLLLVDEASGVPESVFEASVGSMSGHNAVTILASNPTRSTGTFYDSQTRLADSWFRVHVSADVPEASPGAFRSERVTPDFIQQVEDQFDGKESNAYRVRVLGEFPRADLDTLISFELVEAARHRDVQVIPSARMVWGLDPARFGDDNTALTKRIGNVVPERVQTRNGLDLMKTAGWVFHEYDSTPVTERPIEIMVDTIGVGAGVCDRLRELGLPVQGVNVSESPSMLSEYANQRAELAGKCKSWLMSRDCKLPDDDALAAELTGIRYTFNSSNKMQLESKKDMKRRIRHSPDRADSLFLTFASTFGVLQNGFAPTSTWNKPIIRGMKGVY